ncbi:MAG TPA: RsmD family RNA methyltransferase [Candidatus Saccharibacteria bacterium]|jgi:16S rRNA (guanine966-N2)-methyltransferase|nr:RsmD family RNA methyltransferase [Candidatus Saccharibacteria bacterium]HMT56292.1 RsmD family RNA methyltransferase [Candidatus Saccharibacteria bacterium]
MRIIAGEFRSRIIKDPKSKKTHPMSEKIRGALFNTLGDIQGLTFLDAFAGSGAVGLEALSRGATKVWAVELDNDSFETLEYNRDLITDESRMSVHKANVRSWLRNQQDMSFDVVIADPPYDAVGIKAIDACAEAVAPNGLLVLSLPPAEHISFKNLKILDEKIYGDAKLVFYRK